MLYILFAFYDDNPRFLDGIEMVVTQQQLVSPLLIIKSSLNHTHLPIIPDSSFIASSLPVFTVCVGAFDK
jgi:hypothetical protein